MKKLSLIWIFCLACLTSQLFAQTSKVADTTSLSEQKDVIDLLEDLFGKDKTRMDSSRLDKKFHFSLIPAAGAVAGGGAAVATAFNVAFYTGDDQTTSLSAVTFTPWFSFDGKFVLPFRNSIWLPNDVVVLKGDTRYMIYPQYTWGLGGQTNSNDKVLLEYNYVRFYQSILRRASKKVFFGGGINIDYHFNLPEVTDTMSQSQIPLYDYRQEYNQPGTSIGPMINFLVDTRGTSINPPRGFYGAIDYRFNAEFLGSTYAWQSIVVDVRKYFPFEHHRQNLLALWGMYWGVTNGRTPYLDLPSIGWDYSSHTGRGFEQNRYRSNHLVYFEAEYRRDLTKNGFFGFVLFTNIHSVSEYENNQFRYWHPAAGTGVRIKFNKISQTNIGLDIATSKDYTGLYVTLGETF